MPPQLLYDITGIDLNRIVYDQEAIREANPQRGHMEHLNGIVHTAPEKGQIIGYKDVRPDEFWVDGHIPGRPLLPGVIMIEAAAQLACFYTKKHVGWTGFIGFGGTGETKFRSEVRPGMTLILIIEHAWTRHRRIGSNCQGIVNGNVAFETEIIGTQM